MMVPPFEHTLGFNRIGRYFVNLYLGRGFHIADPQGICGAKMIEEDDPKTLRDDHILTMFTVNSGTGQVVYNVKLLEPKVFGAAGSGPGQFRRPHGICCNPAGDVYVADTDNNRVVRQRRSRVRPVGAGRFYHHRKHMPGRRGVNHHPAPFPAGLTSTPGKLPSM